MTDRFTDPADKIAYWESMLGDGGGETSGVQDTSDDFGGNSSFDVGMGSLVPRLVPAYHHAKHMGMATSPQYIAAGPYGISVPPTRIHSPYFPGQQRAVAASNEDDTGKEGYANAAYDVGDVEDQTILQDRTVEDQGRRGSPDEPVATAERLQQRKDQQRQVEAVSKHGIPLIPISDIASKWRSMFSKFPTFNAVQSKVFESVYNTDENLVVSSPTGSGKTTIFELAFIRMIRFAEDCGEGDLPLAIYLAPTKALCTERAMDWKERLKPTGIECAEVTGDTANPDMVIKALTNASLIVTTPEKWDSLTRRPDNMTRLVCRLKLVMIDEVHILRESRGSTLEVIVSRMKTRGEQVRFVALSASIPNIDDIARWLGPGAPISGPTGVYEGGGDISERDSCQIRDAIQELPKAKVYKFGEEFRPVPLVRQVYAYDAPNDWALNTKLDQALYPLLIKHSEGKPVLVFCPTRKSCQVTADHIYKMIIEARTKGRKLPWNHEPGLKLQLSDKTLEELSSVGIAVHHAGLDFVDRKAIEQAFLGGQLHMIASTSTLAVGVNLPAHTVVIKSTMTWNGPIEGFREYSDIDIQQMMGRAGRPQFDKSGTVVVMCNRSKYHRYRDMLNSQTILESCLHENLTEHINSEIGLGTITCLRAAQDWVKSSFLYIRIQQNPGHYAMSVAREKPAQKSWNEWLDHYVEDALISLEEKKLVEHDISDNPEDDRQRLGLTLTKAGDIMARNFISIATMANIMQMPPDADMRALLEIMAGAAEFKDLRIRPGETQVLNKLRSSDALHFHLEENAKTYADKVFIYLQICWANVDLSMYQTKTENTPPHQILLGIYQHAPRIAKAICSFASLSEYGFATKSALELLCAVTGKSWENDATVFRQIDNVGPKSIRLLNERGINTFDKLLQTDQMSIEAALRRNNTFVQKVLAQARAMPRFAVKVEEDDVDLSPGRSPTIHLRIHLKPIHDIDKVVSKSSKFKKYMIYCLITRSDGKFITFRYTRNSAFKKTTTASFAIDVELDEAGQKVIVFVGPQEFAGCSTTVEYDPNLLPHQFPSQPKQAEKEGSEDGDHVSKDGGSDRMPIGCNHACRHKDLCSHACCKDGLKEKPKKGKNGAGERKISRKNPRLAVDAVHSLVPKELGVVKAVEGDTDEEPLFLPGDEDDVIVDEERLDLTKPKKLRGGAQIINAHKQTVSVMREQQSGTKRSAEVQYAETAKKPRFNETTRPNVKWSKEDDHVFAGIVDGGEDVPVKRVRDEEEANELQLNEELGPIAPVAQAGAGKSRKDDHEDWLSFDPFAFKGTLPQRTSSSTGSAKDAVSGTRMAGAQRGRSADGIGSLGRGWRADGVPEVEQAGIYKRGRAKEGTGWPDHELRAGYRIAESGSSGNDPTEQASTGFVADNNVNEQWRVTKDSWQPMASSDDPNLGLDEDDDFLKFVRQHRA